MLVWLLALVVPLGFLPAGRAFETGRQDYQVLIDEYRRGDAEAAVTKLAAMGPDAIERLRPAGALEESPWAWAASLLLRTEAKHRYFYATATWSRVRDGRTVMYWDGVRDRIDAASLRDLRALLGFAVRTGDERLRDYCRGWYMTALHSSGKTFFDASANLFQGDPDVLVARGRYLEFWMGPDPRLVNSSGHVDVGRYIELLSGNAAWAGPDAFGWVARDEPLFKTEHGLFGSWARRAMETYREALEIAPDLTEARLRLGRVLYLMARHDDALREFGRALADARTRGQIGIAYLAALFSGQLHEFEGRPSDGVRSYRAAIAVCPRCPAAPVALLRLHLTSGGAASGWQAIGELFGHADEGGALATDPSATYIIFPGSFLHGQRYVALRRWVRTE